MTAVMKEAVVEEVCPRFPEPVLLKHPIPSLKMALEKVSLVAHIFI